MALLLAFVYLTATFTKAALDMRMVKKFFFTSFAFANKKRAKKKTINTHIGITQHTTHPHTVDVYITARAQRETDRERKKRESVYVSL